MARQTEEATISAMMTLSNHLWLAMAWHVRRTWLRLGLGLGLGLGSGLGLGLG